MITDCFNAFNSQTKGGAHEGGHFRSGAYTVCCKQFYGERSAPMLFQMDSGERRKIDCPSSVQQGTPWTRDTMGAALFCVLLPYSVEADPWRVWSFNRRTCSFGGTATGLLGLVAMPMLDSSRSRKGTTSTVSIQTSIIPQNDDHVQTVQCRHRHISKE